MAWNWSGAASGALSGGVAGTTVSPGWGTAIGAVGGGILGGFTGGNDKKSKGSKGGGGGNGDVWQQSLLTPEQQKLHAQLVNAAMQEGAGGAFGTSADYYRNLLSDNPEDLKAFAAPELRRYNEEIVPGLSEQFAGMGSGGLSSSGFRNAQIQGATDLSERLGAIRANLRQSGAQGLTNIGQLGLNPVVENLRNTPQPSSGDIFSGIAGEALPGAISGLTDWFKGSGGSPGGSGTTGSFNTSPTSFGSTSPYGGGSISRGY
jgi:hypothetical protein